MPKLPKNVRQLKIEIGKRLLNAPNENRRRGRRACLRRAETWLAESHEMLSALRQVAQLSMYELDSTNDFQSTADYISQIIAANPQLRMWLDFNDVTRYLQNLVFYTMRSEEEMRQIMPLLRDLS